MATEPDTCELLCLDLPKAEAASARLPDPDRLEARAAGAKALADPTRLAVAVALSECGTACVCDLAWIVARDEKLVSHHARALRAAGLASSARHGEDGDVHAHRPRPRAACRRHHDPGERRVSASAELPMVTAVAPARPVATISPERYRELAAA